MKRAVEHMQSAYEKSGPLLPGIRMLIWREKCRVENVLWYVKNRGKGKGA